MNHQIFPSNNLSSYRSPARLILLASALVIVGAVGLIAGFVASAPEAWLWLVVIFVVFSGISNGTLLWAAVFRTAQAKWTPAINRLAHAVIAFTPAMGVVLIVLLMGIANYVPWVSHPVPEKTAWLNVPFMIVRDLIALGVLWILYLLMVRWSLAADARVRRGERIDRAGHFRLNSLTVAVVMTYSISTTIIAWDFIMSLSPMWVSTMFAPYIFCTNAYAGLATLVILSAALRRPLGVEEYIGREQFHDMGNLMLVFALFNMGLFFAQYITIWYENLPKDETFFLIIRYLRGPWPYLGWAAFFIGYAVPFMLLQSRMIKRSPAMLTSVAVIAILGVALERYVLVVPSIYPNKLMLVPAAALGLLAFVGLFILATVFFLSRYAPVSAIDEALAEANQPEGELDASA